MSDRHTTGWCQGSCTMLKHRPTDRSHTYIPPDAFSNWTHQTAQQGAESNGYRGTGPGERFRSVNERSSHHRVVSGQLHNAQTPANRPLPHVNTTRCVLELGRPNGVKSTQKEASRNGYRVTGSDERTRWVNGTVYCHRGVLGRPHNAQTSTPGPRASVQKL